MECDDRDLLSRVGANDRGAFAEFYDRYSARVFGLLVRRLGRGPEAEDVLQETFLQVWKRAGQFDVARGTPLTWLMMIARSKLADQLRRNRPAMVPGRDHPAASGWGAPDPSARAELTEAQREARMALSELSVEQQDAIRSAFYDGLSHQEIAERCGVPLGTVKTRIRQGMIKLRDRLREKASVNP